MNGVRQSRGQNVCRENWSEWQMPWAKRGGCKAPVTPLCSLSKRLLVRQTI